MKTTFSLRGFFAACLVFACSLTATATVYLNENFDGYTVGNLSGQGSWSVVTGTTDPIQATADNLSLAGYADAVTGGKAAYVKRNTSVTTGEDLRKDFSTSTAGKSFYVSFLVNVTERGKEAAFFTLIDNKLNSVSKAINPRLYVIASPIEDNANQFHFSIGKSNESGGNVVSTETAFNLNTTYLVVLKYQVVEGTLNDILDLFVLSTASNQEPKNSAATATGGTDVSSEGCAGVQLRQHANHDGSKHSATAIVDAIRVADTWAELFPDAGDITPPTPTPVIKVSDTDDLFSASYIFAPDKYTEPFTISATDLTGDITLSSSNPAFAVPATISKEAAMAEGGAEVSITLTTTAAGAYATSIQLASEGAETKTITVSCYASPTVDNIAAWKAYNALDAENNILARLKQAVTITQIYKRNDLIQWVVQDASGALFVSDDEYALLIPDTYTIGDQIPSLVLLAYDGVLYMGAAPAAATGNAPLVPTVVTLEEWDADKAKYCGMLIRVNGVELAPKAGEETFEYPKQYAFHQGTLEGFTSLFADSELIGTSLPTSTIDIIGIARNKNTLLLSPRMPADIFPSSTTALPTTSSNQLWVANGALHLESANAMQVEVLNVAGQTIVSETFSAGVHTITLDNGMYIVKTNNTTQKIIIR